MYLYITNVKFYIFIYNALTLLSQKIIIIINLGGSDIIKKSHQVNKSILVSKSVLHAPWSAQTALVSSYITEYMLYQTKYIYLNKGILLTNMLALNMEYSFFPQ